MIMNDFTLLVPTHNRHHYIKRSMEYFKDLDAMVIYCDSSQAKYAGVIPSNIEYLHVPNLNFAEKILKAISLVNTSKIALCADDDFILIESLYKGDEFLKNHFEYSTVVGQYAGFKKKFDGVFFEMYKWHDSDKDINKDVVENAKTFFLDYHQILWAMYRKEVVKSAFEVIVKSEFKNDNFIELTIGACACFKGGIKILNDLWGVREKSSDNHWALRHLPLSVVSEKELKEDFSQFRKYIDAGTFEGYADLVISSYLNENKLTNSIRKLRWVFPKPMKSFMKKFIINKESNLKHTKQEYDNQLSIISNLLFEKNEV